MIDEDLLEALRDAIDLRLRGAARDGEVRRALRAVSRSARARALPVEQVVIAIKHVWNSLPQMQQTIGRAERRQMLDRIVTLCIEAYYEDDGPSHD